LLASPQRVSAPAQTAVYMDTELLRQYSWQCEPRNDSTLHRRPGREIAVSESLRKAYKYKLKPTPEQECQLEAVLWRCRVLYNTALEQRRTAWERCHVSVSRYQQEAELTAFRAEMPEFAAIHSHVLQDVLARLDKAYQAFFRRLKAGEAP